MGYCFFKRSCVKKIENNIILLKNENFEENLLKLDVSSYKGFLTINKIEEKDLKLITNQECLVYINKKNILGYYLYVKGIVKYNKNLSIFEIYKKNVVYLQFTFEQIKSIHVSLTTSRNAQIDISFV